MSTLPEDLQRAHPRRSLVFVVSAVVLTVPGVLLWATEPQLVHPLEALLYGLAIVGAAFLLSWAAEVAQLDISAGLAIAILALIAVLPEYAVDFVFASKGGESYRLTGPACLPIEGGSESPCSLALANMTGANRLLIGIGWTMVVFIAFWRLKRKGRIPKGRRWTGVHLERQHSIELAFLGVATIYSLTLPLKTSITLVDAAILITLFVLYTVRVSKAPSEEPHLVGPAAWLGTFRTTARRGAIVVMLGYAAGVILLVAERFAEALVKSGEAVGVSEFLLVQWLAPLASEAPELLIAGMFAWRLNTSAGLGTLVSSKVNQWTLLVGTLPIVFAVSSHSLHGLPIDAVQRQELFLTAAQSFLAVAILANLSMSLREAGYLFGLFWIQFILGAVAPASIQGAERITVAIVYLVLGLWVIVGDRARVGRLFREGLRTPPGDLVDDPTAAPPLYE